MEKNHIKYIVYVLWAFTFIFWKGYIIVSLGVNPLTLLKINEFNLTWFFFVCHRSYSGLLSRCNKNATTTITANGTNAQYTQHRNTQRARDTNQSRNLMHDNMPRYRCVHRCHCANTSPQCTSLTLTLVHWYTLESRHWTHNASPSTYSKMN